MTLSAKRLGEKIGLNSQQMNVLLKEEGYQNGEPGAYAITEKGKPYVVEKGWDNGYGGYAARSYNYNEWDESILDTMDISPERLSQIRTITSENRKKKKIDINNEKHLNSICQPHEDNSDLEEYDIDNSLNMDIGRLAIIIAIPCLIYKGAKHLYTRYKRNV